uniref:TctD transcriptional regulator n=1 Tax=Sebdenia flabellata TaxID=42024 RepID=A0A1C9CA33_9FLOR|nr:hypothetical protein Sebd_154 [Sebdenia flabellata]AOM65241.1 hypothetical protein Sebd_154 [Sebdenia flabellata]
MKRQLLIVDDDIKLLNSISSYLKAEGFLVDTADSVKSALLSMRVNKPDLIITDIMMSDLDGYDFIQIIRSDNLLRVIPIIFVTAKGMTSDRILGYNLGCNAYISKPFSPQELLSIIHNLFKNIELLTVNQPLKPDELSIKNNTSFVYNLTDKEKSILSLLVKGLMNKEIAIRLNLNLRNVEKYVSRLLNKTNTRNRTELTQFALSHNIYSSKGE